MPCGIHHGAVKAELGFKNARRVDQVDLCITFGQHAHDTHACGLRLGADDGNFLPDQAVHQCRFTGVGRADNGNEARACRSGNSFGRRFFRGGFFSRGLLGRGFIHRRFCGHDLFGFCFGGGGLFGCWFFHDFFCTCARRSVAAAFSAARLELPSAVTGGWFCTLASITNFGACGGPERSVTL